MKLGVFWRRTDCQPSASKERSSVRGLGYIGFCLWDWGKFLVNRSLVMMRVLGKYLRFDPCLAPEAISVAVLVQCSQMHSFMWLYPALSCAVICVSGLDILIIFMNNMQHFYLKKLGNHFSSEPLVNILSPRRPASGCGVIQNFPCTRVSLTSYLRHLGVCVCVFTGILNHLALPTLLLTDAQGLLNHRAYGQTYGKCWWLSSW